MGTGQKKKSLLRTFNDFRVTVGAFAFLVGLIAWLIEKILSSAVFRVSALLVIGVGLAVVLSRVLSKSEVKRPERR